MSAIPPKADIPCDNTKGLSTWPWGNSRCLGMVSVYAIACVGTLLVYCGAKFGEFPEV
jgi:hypothetical protein